MGDHRVNIEISVVGTDGKKQSIDWWLNWDENMPAKVFEAMVDMAQKARLPVETYYDNFRE